MTAKEYLKQAYLLDKQIQVEVKELEQLRKAEMTSDLGSLISGAQEINGVKHHFDEREEIAAHLSGKR